MARKSDIDADLVFEMDGVDITPDKFVRGVGAFFTLLTEITGEVCSDNDGVHWRVQVKTGSNLIEAIPDPGAAPVYVEAILDSMNEGVERLENMEDEPAGWTLKAINSLKTIGALSGVNEDDDTSMQIWVRKQRKPVTHRTVARAAELTKGYTDHGSVEGRLQMLSERGSLHLVVYEPISDRPIRCYINENLRNNSRDAFGKRVEIFGNIRYQLDGTPKSIKAEEIVTFPDAGDLPSVADVEGILRNYH